MELTAREGQAWYNVITDFPGYYNAFQNNFSALIAQAPYVQSTHPELLPQYNKLVEDGNALYSKLYTVKQNIDALQTKISSIGETVRSWIGLGEMGIAPVIWAGMAAGSAVGVFSAVGSWLTKSAETAKRLEEYKRLESAGMSPQQATIEVEKRMGPPGSPATFFGVPLSYIFLGVIGLIALPMILRGGSK